MKVSGYTTNGLIVACMALLAACGDAPVKTCDEVQTYQKAREHQRVDVPEGLSPLDPNKEMPMPQASPRDPRPAGSPCIDLPPSILTGEEE